MLAVFDFNFAVILCNFFFLPEGERKDPGLSVRFCCFTGVFSGSVLVSICVHIAMCHGIRKAVAGNS